MGDTAAGRAAEQFRGREVQGPCLVAVVRPAHENVAAGEREAQLAGVLDHRRDDLLMQEPDNDPCEIPGLFRIDIDRCDLSDSRNMEGACKPQLGAFLCVQHDGVVDADAGDVLLVQHAHLTIPSEGSDDTNARPRVRKPAASKSRFGGAAARRGGSAGCRMSSAGRRKGAG